MENTDIKRDNTLKLAIGFAAAGGISFFIMSLAFALDEAMGGWQFIGAIACLLPLFIFSVLCLFYSILLLIKRTYTPVALCFVLTSSLMMTPYTSIPLARALSKPLIIFGESVKEVKTKINDYAENQQKLKVYRYLSKEFESPQKIINVKHRYILLENKKAIDLLYPCNYGIVKSRESRIENYLSNAIISKNKPVQIKLPEYSKFAEAYKTKPSFRIFEFQDMEYGYIPALIYLDGELINIIFANGLDEKVELEFKKCQNR